MCKLWISSCLAGINGQYTVQYDLALGAKVVATVLAMVTTIIARVYGAEMLTYTFHVKRKVCKLTHFLPIPRLT